MNRTCPPCDHQCSQRHGKCPAEDHYTPDDAYRWTNAAAALIVCAVIAAIAFWSMQ